ncbi:unnamed protein product [Peniophora sp. CBMAI 1063]|nr:unnamed protein product [Peniophora sp. CBMAI 1063]
MAVTESYSVERIPSALRPGPHDRVPSLVFVEATTRPAVARAQTTRQKPGGRHGRARRTATAPAVRPVDTVSPFSPRPESPAPTFSPIELLFAGEPLPSPYSVDSLKSIDSVLSMSVQSTSGAPRASDPGITPDPPLEDVVAHSLESSSDAPESTDTPKSTKRPLAAKTFGDLKTEHERYARALLRVASLESAPSETASFAPTSIISRSSTTGSRTEGATLSALSVMRFARAPSRIPRLQRDSTNTSSSSSQSGRALSKDRRSSDIVVGVVVDDCDDIFSTGAGDATGATAGQSPIRQNAFSKALSQHGLSVITNSSPHTHIRPDLPAFHGDVEDLAAADSYLAALEALLGVTPPRPSSASSGSESDFDQDSEYGLTPVLDARISARLAKIGSRDGAASRKELDDAALSHIVALEAHLEALAARIPPLGSETADNAQDRTLQPVDDAMRTWLTETGTAARGEVYLPRLEAHLEGLLARVEQQLFPASESSPTINVQV